MTKKFDQILRNFNQNYQDKKKDEYTKTAKEKPIYTYSIELYGKKIYDI